MLTGLFAIISLEIESTFSVKKKKKKKNGQEDTDLLQAMPSSA